jgi:hypothetical protein
VDINPSNGLAAYLDMTAGEPDLDLGTTATINTNDGTVKVDGRPVMVRSALVAQTSAPTILVFIVHSLAANDVTISGSLTGGNAFALVSNGDIKIGGIFAASALSYQPGPGGYDNGTCRGGDGRMSDTRFGGAGGGGFGLAGGSGGAATTDGGTSVGGDGGAPTGNPTLVPLRGGCSAGLSAGANPGAGGGAMQLVSRTKITISGVVAANGTSVSGGGSGGGILLEAPAVEVLGSVVANGGAGASGCVFSGLGENGRLDATPANGGIGCPPIAGNGGNGGAGDIAAGNGASINVAGTGTTTALGGNGGGGVGRIRINTVSGGLRRAGVFSPNPSTGALATR